MRIACFGLVDRNGGSVTSANYLILDELLRRGHQIDFYTFEGFTREASLRTWSNFHVITIDTSRECAQYDRLPGWTPAVLKESVSQYQYHVRNLPKLEQQIAACHRRRAYDLCLYLGTPSQCKTPAGLPVLAWVQGPPQTEWESIERLRSEIVALCGRALYWKLKAFYLIKRRATLAQLRRSDLIVCGSEWSRRQIIRAGFEASQTLALPYPIDQGLFQLALSPGGREDGRFEYLWLGRIDARKRLDLLLESFDRLIRAGKDVHLTIVGPYGHYHGYRRLIDDFPHPERLSYAERVPRDLIPSLLSRADVLIQPSEAENFGSAVAEALCCGTPVIVGPTNGTGEYAGEACFRFDSYTPEALKDAMERAYVTARDRPGMSAEARRLASLHFGVHTVANRLEQALEQLAGSPRIRPFIKEAITL